jgi:hypothetical protein
MYSHHFGFLWARPCSISGCLYRLLYCCIVVLLYCCIVVLLYFFLKKPWFAANPRVKRIKFFCSAGAVALLYWWIFFKPVTWREDVQLSDGQVITVRQYVHGKTCGGFAYERCWWSTGYELAFPSNTGIKTNLFQELGSPLVLDKTKEGEWFVIVAVEHCYKLRDLAKELAPVGWEKTLTPWEADLYKKYGGVPIRIQQYIPRKNYFEYRYRDGTWTVHDIAPEHFGRLFNLVGGSIYGHKGILNPWHHLDLKDKVILKNEEIPVSDDVIKDRLKLNCEQELPPLNPEGAMK